MEAARALGKQLRRLRESAQLTQDLMVKLRGGSTTSISRYESGDRIPRTAYVKALLEEAALGGVSLTEDARAAVWALYERALGPVGGRNSERAALYAQEKQLRLVQEQEAQAVAELARLAAERDGLKTESGADLVRREELDSDGARIREACVLLARRRQQILATIGRMPHPRDDDFGVKVLSPAREPGPGQREPAPPAAVPPWQHLVRSLAVALIAVAAVVWGVVLFQRDHAGPAAGAAADATSPALAPSPEPPRTETPPASLEPSPSPAPPSTSPPVPPASAGPSSPSASTAAVRVRWRGNLVLDNGDRDGVATLGWELDPAPPRRSVGGDIALSCLLVCEPGRYAGQTIVVFNGTGTPRREECADLLNANPGSRTADVPDGTIACFGTRAKRVGYFTPHTAGQGQTRITATVWELPPDSETNGAPVT
ncbi:helix-turn-helix domain-containing protein [Streptomyces sp. MW-W600-10]|uniref:helix-turn-helix domain-containing protein n=1 Tax=Streptomyces sp. MW-W600-10 TaxID=2829819 RepID=UPI001C449C91|nr:helix-turn-helix transcriptional regulator [Streptomyces sp. MW-W600-10]MBV7249199.1 helix-turn-helix transcriptional regulator [Streptomyces sp. MW-W600-10]